MDLNNSLVILLGVISVNYAWSGSEILLYWYLEFQMKKMIMDTKLHHTDHLHYSNQAKYIITSKAKNKLNKPAHLILVLMAFSKNEGSC